MKTWKLQKDVIALFEDNGYQVTRLCIRDSPYADFDLVAHPAGFKIGENPALYTVSPVEMKTEDPATAYKGRHGVGRLIMASPSFDGLVTVASNSGDSVELVLANGISLGKKRKVSFTIGDLFPEL